MLKLGHKSALVGIRDLPIGSPDTLLYESAEEFEAGFRRNIAFAQRVLKQSFSSYGAGVWIIKLKDDSNYC